MITELEKFNTVLRKVLSVSREELARREKEWKRTHPQKGQKRGRKPSNDDSSKKND
jgi:hypothetical protein